MSRLLLSRRGICFAHQASIRQRQRPRCAFSGEECMRDLPKLLPTEPRACPPATSEDRLQSFWLSLLLLFSHRPSQPGRPTFLPLSYFVLAPPLQYLLTSGRPGYHSAKRLLYCVILQYQYSVRRYPDSTVADHAGNLFHLCSGRRLGRILAARRRPSAPGHARTDSNILVPSGDVDSGRPAHSAHVPRWRGRSLHVDVDGVVDGRAFPRRARLWSPRPTCDDRMRRLVGERHPDLVPVPLRRSRHRRRALPGRHHQPRQRRLLFRCQPSLDYPR